MSYKASDREMRLAKFHLYSLDPIAWLTEQVRTEDEHDRQEPVKVLPIDKPYLRWLAEAWSGMGWAYDEAVEEEVYQACRKDPPWMLIEKSRQLIVSWLMVSLHLWELQFKPGTRTGLLSRTEVESQALQDRMWGVRNRQDKWLIEMLPARRIGHPQDLIIWDSRGPAMPESTCRAIPEGEHVGRSFTYSSVLFDEMSVNRYAEAMCGAMWPTLYGGGRFTGVWTAHPGYAQRVMTQVKAMSQEQTEPMPGLTVWGCKASQETHGEADEVLAGMGFMGVRLHYSADPDPLTARKVAQAKATAALTSSQAWFQKEYEIQYDALGGQLVWPELRPETHAIDPFLIPAEWRRFRVIDHGFRNPTAVLWAAVSPPGWRGCVDPVSGTKLEVVVFYREMYVRGWTVQDLARQIELMSAGEAYEATWIDPSTRAHRGSEFRGLSVFESFGHYGIPVVSADNNVQAGLDEVRRRLRMHSESPAVLFFSTLTHTLRECQGYRYQELSDVQASRKNTPEDVVKVDDHTCDCVRYMLQMRPMPRPNELMKPGPGTFGHLLDRVKSMARFPKPRAYTMRVVA